jgi:glycosyltransferase involved in cell wall biosynthesis
MPLLNHRSSTTKKLLWVAPLILDMHIHKTTQIEILKGLSRRGYSATLMATYSRNNDQAETLPIRLLSVPVRYVPVISPIIYAVMVFFFLPFYIIKNNPDYIIAEPDVSVFGFVSALPFSALTQTKLILDVRSTPVETSGLRGRLTIFFFDASVLIAKEFFDGMTILTPLMKEEVQQKFTISPQFIGVWSSGVSTKLFNPQNYVFEAKKLRNILGLSQKFVIFYHGALTANRGLKESIEAMAIVKHECPDAVLFLLGRGPAETINEYNDVIKKNQLQENVFIHDPVDYVDVPKFIEMSTVAIVPLPNHPYWRFQSPLKLLEYLAMEKAVILTEIPAHCSVVGSNPCGIYVSSIAPQDIAKSILYAYQNRSDLAAWGKTGRKVVDENYTWDKMAERLDEYLRLRST